jgi:hypothetical protein
MIFFGWIRSKVKTAILAGIADAVELLEPGGPDELAPAGERLEARLQVALPMPGPESGTEQTAARGQKQR